MASYESSRSTFNWRVRRLTKYGLIARHTVPSAGKAFVYSITPAGELELAGIGEQFLTTPAKPDRNDKELQVAHSLELNNIHLSLLRADLLVRWVPEIQLRSRNLSMGVRNGKVYDAIVTVRLDDRDATFALEYERTAKSEGLYAEVRNKFEAEQDLDRFLYLASTEDVLKFVSWQFRNSKRNVCFGLLADWYRRLLDTEVFDWNMSSIPAVPHRLNGRHRPCPGFPRASSLKPFAYSVIICCPSLTFPEARQPTEPQGVAF